MSRFGDHTTRKPRLKRIGLPLSNKFERKMELTLEKIRLLVQQRQFQVGPFFEISDIPYEPFHYVRVWGILRTGEMVEYYFTEPISPS
jgi:hypothetical protein